MADIHKAAANGYAAGAEVYATGRPEYPPAIADWLKTRLALAPGKRVLDLGAGTGKFVAPLRATGAQVTAVEPVEAMRQRLAEEHPDVTALAGTAAAIPLADDSMDAVTCAQSFHWFATREAVAEIRRVLKPDGVLGLVWNVRDESVDWVAALTRIIDRYAQGEPRHRTGAWRQVFPAEGFGPLELTVLAHSGARGSPEDVIVRRVLSTSFIAALSENERAKVRADVQAMITTSPSLAGKAIVEFPYFTEAYCCRRLRLREGA